MITMIFAEGVVAGRKERKMFSLSWYLVGGLVAFGVGILVGFEIADKEHKRSIDRMRELYQGNIKTLVEMLPQKSEKDE